ncbi:MAG: hypothetical protein GC164_11630 [Phycisphaera sp.]|nr:hypothetical protein [Phycisphaera sp.]
MSHIKTTLPLRITAARRGMTIFELLIALSATALIGMAIASMLFATTHGTESSKDMRVLVVKERTVTGRLAAAIRSSKMILSSGGDYMVLWMYDTDGSGKPNRDEIRYIERVNGSGELWSYTVDWPDAWSTDTISSNNTEYELTANFASLIPALKTQSWFVGEKWGTGVSAWTTALNDTDAQAATLASYRLTFTAGDLSDLAVGAAALRNSGVVGGTLN